MGTKKDFIFKDNKVVNDYVEIILNIDKIAGRRAKILSRHFNEINILNVDDLEDRDAKILRILGKETTHPTCFLASSLGYNRSTWNKAYEKVLRSYGLGKRPKHCTLRTMLLFEKLKLLIAKACEKNLVK